MTNEEFEHLKVGDKIYYARIMPTLNYYEVEDLQIVIIDEKHIVACHMNSARSFMFFRKDIAERVFIDRMQAVTVTKDIQEANKDKYKKDEEYEDEYRELSKRLHG